MVDKALLDWVKKPQHDWLTTVIAAYLCLDLWADNESDQAGGCEGLHASVGDDLTEILRERAYAFQKERME